MRRILYLTTLLLAGLAGLSGAPVLTLTPENISGTPGQTMGWGFTLTADQERWVAVVGSLLSNESNPSLGIYNDRIGLQGGPLNGLLAPGSPAWQQSFGGLTSAGSSTIDPFAVVGSVNTSTLTVLIEYFSRNPTECVDGCFLGSDTLSSPVSIGVSQVPEPGTWLPTACGGAALLLARRQRA